MPPGGGTRAERTVAAYAAAQKLDEENDNDPEAPAEKTVTVKYGAVHFNDKGEICDNSGKTFEELGYTEKQGYTTVFGQDFAGKNLWEYDVKNKIITIKSKDASFSDTSISLGGGLGAPINYAIVVNITDGTDGLGVFTGFKNHALAGKITVENGEIGNGYYTGDVTVKTSGSINGKSVFTGNVMVEAGGSIKGGIFKNKPETTGDIYFGIVIWGEDLNGKFQVGDNSAYGGSPVILDSKDFYSSETNTGTFYYGYNLTQKIVDSSKSIQSVNDVDISAQGTKKIDGVSIKREEENITFGKIDNPIKDKTFVLSSKKTIKPSVANSCYFNGEDGLPTYEDGTAYPEHSIVKANTWTYDVDAKLLTIKSGTYYKGTDKVSCDVVVEKNAIFYGKDTGTNYAVVDGKLTLNGGKVEYCTLVNGVTITNNGGTIEDDCVLPSLPEQSTNKDEFITITSDEALKDKILIGAGKNYKSAQIKGGTAYWKGTNGGGVIIRLPSLNAVKNINGQDVTLEMGSSWNLGGYGGPEIKVTQEADGDYYLTMKGKPSSKKLELSSKRMNPTQNDFKLDTDSPVEYTGKAYEPKVIANGADFAGAKLTWKYLAIGDYGYYEVDKLTDADTYYIYLIEIDGKEVTYPVIMWSFTIKPVKLDANKLTVKLNGNELHTDSTLLTRKAGTITVEYDGKPLDPAAYEVWYRSTTGPNAQPTQTVPAEDGQYTVEVRIGGKNYEELKLDNYKYQLVKPEETKPTAADFALQKNEDGTSTLVCKNNKLTENDYHITYWQKDGDSWNALAAAPTAEQAGEYKATVSDKDGNAVTGAEWTFSIEKKSEPTKPEETKPTAADFALQKNEDGTSTLVCKNDKLTENDYHITYWQKDGDSWKALDAAPTAEQAGDYKATVSDKDGNAVTGAEWTFSIEKKSEPTKPEETKPTAADFALQKNEDGTSTLVCKNNKLTENDYHITYWQKDGDSWNALAAAPTAEQAGDYKATVSDKDGNAVTGAEWTFSIEKKDDPTKPEETKPTAADFVLQKNEDGTSTLVCKNNKLTENDYHITYWQKDGDSWNALAAAPTAEQAGNYKATVSDKDGNAVTGAEWTFSIEKKSEPVEPDQPDEPAVTEPDALHVATVAVGAAAFAGAVAVPVYGLATEAYIRAAMPAGIAVPADRIELAKLLWQQAGKPEPASTALFEDIAADDTDAQKAARWVVEQGLLKVSEDKPAEFRAAKAVTRLRVCLTWHEAKAKGLVQ